MFTWDPQSRDHSLLSTTDPQNWAESFASEAWHCVAVPGSAFDSMSPLPLTKAEPQQETEALFARWHPHMAVAMWTSQRRCRNALTTRHLAFLG